MVSMNEREQLIEKLVTTMHLNMPERLALSPKSLRYSEVAAVVARVLEDTGYFPPGAQPWQEGNVVHEGAILQKLPGGGFRLTIQRSHPIAPTVLAAKKESDFRYAGAAIRAFIRSEWPKGIDGIAIRRFGILGI
jgi:hypothetical protein